MNIVLSFVGTLPHYIEECIHQIRCFFHGPVYLILDDLQSEFLKNLYKYHITIVSYNSVKSDHLIEVFIKYQDKFCITHWIKGREFLFVRSFERFFLLKNLMNQKGLKDVLFLELDNLIYDEPEKWLAEFSKNDLCYMFDNIDRCSSGIMYVKKADILDDFTEYIIRYIEITDHTKEFLSEMMCLYRYYMQKQEKQVKIQILPTYWPENSIPEMATTHFNKYGDSIFDALSIGCNLLGLDPFHTKGEIKKGINNPWGAIDYTKNKIEWKTDINGRKRPCIFYEKENKWLLVNNLHVHSKDLKNGLSLPL